MEVLFWILVCAGSVLWFGYLGNMLRANHVTHKKRMELIARWKTSGDAVLALKEYESVSYGEHYKAAFWFNNTKDLYGPLLQGVWDTDAQQVYDAFWWRCYNEIYVYMRDNCLRGDYTIRYNMAYWGCNLPGAIVRSGINPEGWFAGKPEPAPEFSMTDGAEEYERIMADQEAMR